MAEGSGSIYNSFKEDLFTAGQDLSSDVFRLILMSSYTPDLDNHTSYSDVSASEYATGSGYTVTGASLTNASVTLDTANDRVVFDADDVTWTNLGPLDPNPTPAAAILYNSTKAGSPLVCVWELGTTATNGGDYTIQFSSSGILLLS